MNKIKIFFKVYFTLFTCIIFAQTEELSRHNEVNDFVKELTKKNIDTICDYELFSAETEAMYTQYVFWKENGKTKLKKIELNSNFPIIEIEVDELWQYLFSNIEIIKTEEVKSFSFIKNNETKEVVSQSEDIKEFNLLLKGIMIKFWTSGFDFQKTEKIEGEKVNNIYFEYNKNLKGKSVIDQLQVITKKLEKLKAFKY